MLYPIFFSQLLLQSHLTPLDILQYKELQQQITIWSKEVYGILRKGAAERLLTEYAKKNEAWSLVRTHSFATGYSAFPEILNF